MERTADHAASIARNVLLLKNSVDAKILEIIERMSEISVSSFEAAIESLFKRDFNTAEGVIEKAEEIVSSEREAVLFLQEPGIEDTANVRLLIESVRRTAEYASDIAEIVLNLTVEATIGLV